MTPTASPPPTRLDSIDRDRKPILKKKTASETNLQRDVSQHTLLQHAGAILKAQEAEQDHSRSIFPRAGVDFRPSRDQTSSSTSLDASTSSSGLVSPGEKRHIHFNNEVAQFIAVEAKDEEPPMVEEESSDDDLVTMRQVTPRASPDHTPRNNENKIIAPLPSTTLKYRGDTPEPPSSLARSLLARWYDSGSSTLSHSPSMETLRPSDPSANFLLDDDQSDIDWQSNQTNQNTYTFHPSSHTHTEEELEIERNLISTSFAPDDADSNMGIVDKVVDTVNTARDIAHVIWNVGWRR